MYVGKVCLSYSSPSGYVNILPFSDLHLGNKLCDLDLFKKHLKLLDEENTYWFCLGDMIDSVVLSDPRFDPKSCGLGDIVLDYADTLIELLEPYKDTCLGYLTGNHEEKLRKKAQIDVSRYIAKQLGVTYMGLVSLLYVSFSRKSHSCGQVWLLTHGSFNGQTRYGKIRKAEELSQKFDADIYFSGHTHDKVYTRVVTYTVNRVGQLVEKERVFVITGGYLRGYSDSVDEYCYVERKLLKPLPLGTPLVRIYPECKRVDVYDNPVW